MIKADLGMRDFGKKPDPWDHRIAAGDCAQRARERKIPAGDRAQQARERKIPAGDRAQRNECNKCEPRVTEWQSPAE